MAAPSHAHVRRSADDGGLVGPPHSTATGDRGRVRADIGRYVFLDRELEYAVGVPKGEQATSAPVAIFVEGDGSRCQRYSRSGWRRFVSTHAERFIVVRPCTLTNLRCGERALAELDFLHRVDELAALVDATKAQFARSDVFLLGESAGAHVAALYARRSPACVRGIVNLGGGVDDFAAVIEAIEERRSFPRRYLDILLRRKRSEAGHVLRQIERNLDSRELFWNRSYRFWYQMFALDVQALWFTCPRPALVIHGEKDRSIVPFDLVAQARARFEQRGADVRFVFVSDKGHNLRSRFVFDLIDDWMRSIEPPSTS